MKKYLFSVFCLLVLFINTAEAHEYGVAIVPLKAEHRKFFLLERDANPMSVEWQLTKDNEVTTTLQRGAISTIYLKKTVFSYEFRTMFLKGAKIAASPEFEKAKSLTDNAFLQEKGVSRTFFLAEIVKANPELETFEGFFHRDNSDYYVDYKINRKILVNKLEWFFSFKAYSNRSMQPAFLVGEAEDIRMDTRLEYSFPDLVSPIKVYYSPNTEATKEKLNKAFLMHSNLSNAQINLNKYGKNNNVTSHFCVFNANTSSTQDLIPHYVYWLDFNKPNMQGLELDPRTIEIIFKDFSWDRNSRDLKIGVKYIDNTKFNFTLAHELPQPSSEKLLKSLEIPSEVRKLEAFSQARLSYMFVNGDFMGMTLDRRYAICYAWPTQIRETGDVNDKFDKNNEDISIVAGQVKKSWAPLINQVNPSVLGSFSVDSSSNNSSSDNILQGYNTGDFYQCAFSLDSKGETIRNASWLILDAAKTKIIENPKVAETNMGVLSPQVPGTIHVHEFDLKSNPIRMLLKLDNAAALDFKKPKSSLLDKVSNPFTTPPMKKPLLDNIKEVMRDYPGFDKMSDEWWVVSGTYAGQTITDHPVLCSKYRATISEMTFLAKKTFNIEEFEQTPKGDINEHKRPDPEEKHEVKQEQHEEVQAPTADPVRPRSDTLEPAPNTRTKSATLD